MDHIYKHFSDKSKKCLSVVICVLAPAYTCLCRDLKYLLKFRYSILVDLNGTGFLTVFLGRSATLSYIWKIHHKNERFLRLVAHIFTKISQNVCLVNTHIFMYWHARCNCKLWSTFFVLLRIFGYFHTLLTIIHVWSALYSPNFHRSCV